MKIAIIGPLELPGSGGVKLHCEEIGSRLAASGHDVTVLVARGPRRAVHRGMTIRRVGRLPIRHVDRIAYSLMASIHVAFHRFDVVHFHSFASTNFARFARRARTRRLVVTAHRVEWQDQKWGRFARALLRHSERTAMRHADLVISVSESLAADLASRFPRTEEIEYVPNGIDLPTPTPELTASALEARGLSPGEYVLVVGRMQPEKGLDTVLAAWERLAERCDALGWRLVVAGGARHRTPFVAAIEGHAARLAPEVQLAGVLGRPELASLYENAGIVVSASHQEGQPLTVMEAMVARRCLVLSDIPAHRELCATAALYFPKDQPDSLAATLCELIADPARRAELGVSAASLALERGFSWDESASRIDDLLRQLPLNAR